MSKKCALVAIIGRPNVGKSTLMNHLLGQKLSITSRKPQTTRQQILGVRTEGSVQLVFIDTPGLHSGQPRAMNRLMNKAALSALRDVDVTLLLCDRMRWTEEDELALVAASKQGASVALVINKVDLLADREALLPFAASLSDRCTNQYGSPTPLTGSIQSVAVRVRRNRFAALQWPRRIQQIMPDGGQNAVVSGSIIHSGKDHSAGCPLAKRGPEWAIPRRPGF